ncbi:MAG: hypothetical protein VW576_02715 [Opitutae bacterium]
MSKVKKRGAILVFVLGLVVLLGTLCLRLMKETVQELRHFSQFHKRDDLRLHAYSLLDITVGVLNEFRTLDGNVLKTGSGWENPIAWSGLPTLDPKVEWSVSLKGESGKLPLFSTEPKILKEIFAIMHAGGRGLVNEDEGQSFYDAWMDWQDEDQNEREEGAEDAYYESMNPPYYTAGKKVKSFKEFRMIKGFGYDPNNPYESGLFFDEFGNETENMRNFRSSFSFYHEGKVNICESSPFLLGYICDDDESLMQEVSEWTPGDGQNFPAIDSTIPFTKGISETFLIEILVRKGRAKFKLHAAVTFAKEPNQSKANNLKTRKKRNEQLKYPVSVLRLRENENLID